jgi:hypothetical protein
VFVLACQRRAWEEGFLETDPGMETARQWLQRLQHVLIALAKGDQDHPSER